MENDYQEVKEFLIARSFELSASELHGSLSGLLCAGMGEDEVDDWLPVIFSERYIRLDEYSGIREEVCNLLGELRNKFEEDGFGFQILLPADNEPIADRLYNITRWCQCYLDTLLQFYDLNEPVSEECSEILEDLQQIADADCEDIDEDDMEDEFALVTIEEHLRVGVQLLYEHLSPGNQNFSNPFEGET